MKRPINRLAFVVLAAALSTTGAYADSFLTGIPDLPLLAGLTEEPEPTVFETDKGRVMTTLAQGRVSPDRIAAYYRETLPALGWKAEAEELAFTRGPERLTIGIREPASNRPILVSFQLVAKLASSKLPE